MQSAMRSMRIKRENDALYKAIDDTVKKLSDDPTAIVRVTSKVARFVLIRHPNILSCGRDYSTQVKSVGAGVQEIYLKIKEGEE